METYTFNENLPVLLTYTFWSAEQPLFKAARVEIFAETNPVIWIVTPVSWPIQPFSSLQASTFQDHKPAFVPVDIIRYRVQQRDSVIHTFKLLFIFEPIGSRTRLWDWPMTGLQACHVVPAWQNIRPHGQLKLKTYMYPSPPIKLHVIIEFPWIAKWLPVYRQKYFTDSSLALTSLVCVYLNH